MGYAVHQSMMQNIRGENALAKQLLWKWMAESEIRCS